MGRAARVRWLAGWLAAVGVILPGPAPCAAAEQEVDRRASWPNGPLVASGRWITDATGAKVTYVGVNWPGSLETMIPEGLQYQSVEAIVSKVKSLGMNAIRLTYATEMVDQYYDNGEKDVPIQDAFANALGQDDGAAIYNKVVANNPSFGAETTRLQVYDAIAAECAKQEIYLHLDNHISKAGWCCSPLDGNSWWGDTYFDVGNWTRGLSFMAEHGKTWSSLTSMSLRNEPRISLTINELVNSYNWENWYKYVQDGANAIHAANTDVLIFLAGLDSDKNLTAVVQGTALEPGSDTFNRNDFDGYGDDKLVLELHVYDNIFGPPSIGCPVVTQNLVDAGFATLSSGAANQFPLVVTEFGFPQNTTTDEDAYASCLLDYFSSQNAGWMIWSLGGSYYIREDTLDRDEEWGLLSHDWSSWRSPDFVNALITPAVEASTAPISGGDDSGGSSGDSSDDGSDDQSDDKPSPASGLSPSRVNIVMALGIFGAAILGSYIS
ncbi:putative beta- -galactanase [Rosellinia necatrix]|uniref:Putative beta--galactanase n=1 Tax=Rosellinia necatrix TaxID=77044 RepID=A0A1W2TQU8_ROSNE|nr:putative beta- -galactanase [Rosellinia necatrix]